MSHQRAPLTAVLVSALAALAIAGCEPFGTSTFELDNRTGRELLVTTETPDHDSIDHRVQPGEIAVIGEGSSIPAPPLPSESLLALHVDAIIDGERVDAYDQDPIDSTAWTEIPDEVDCDASDCSRFVLELSDGDLR